LPETKKLQSEVSPQKKFSKNEGKLARLPVRSNWSNLNPENEDLQSEGPPKNNFSKNEGKLARQTAASVHV